jgi:hypothetical protein
MRIRTIAASAAAAAALLVGAAPAPSGAGIVGFTVNPPSAVVGTTTLVTATLTPPDTCDADLRLALLDASNEVVTENGNGGVTGATQIVLGLYEESTTFPPAGTYRLRLTCGGQQVNGLIPFTITAPPPPPEPTPEPAPVVVTAPSFTG